jgi:hypothetical protein
MIMQVRRPYKWIIIPLNHGMILFSHEICGPMRVPMIHSSEGVHIVGLQWMDYFLNSVLT